MNGIYWMLAGDRMRLFEVSLENGRLEARPTEQPSHRYLVPGFVDIHIHGAFGIDFMSATRAQMSELAGKLQARGYEAFYPTTVSATAQDVSKALASLPDDPRIPGFHLEGPFISGLYPGAQPPQAILDPPTDDQDWQAILRDPRLKLATLAPERPGALELARGMAAQGRIVSMGHTAATFEQAQQGFEAGFRHATHTYNAMRPFHHREPGVIGFTLLNDEMSAELIYDRKHVSCEAAALLLKCKPPDKVIAVSDGTMAAGLPAGQSLNMWGLEVETRDAAVFLKGTDTLAGSAITLLDAFKNLAQDFGLPTAIRLCSLNPRRAMGISDEPKVWAEFDSNLELVDIHPI